MLSILGAAIAAALSGAGTAWGVSIPGRAANGLLSEEPEKFGNCLILVALPGTQGIYGFISGVIILITLGLLGGEPKHPTLLQGLAFLGVGIFQATVQWVSSIYQGKVCAAGIAIVAKHPEDSMKGVVNGVIVETYAVLGLLITLLLILFGIAPTLK
ncbi:MAG TPA: V-type ATP synthase subunit K [Elusimicrobia bacterium]|jgi:V/A-type H+-transporting ATPase subunit K|nr:V-type ATP synthase subunit K [Elusimicrobiota bacterium]